MIGAKLSDQRNSSNAGRFKSTNQRLASHGFPARKPKNRPTAVFGGSLKIPIMINGDGGFHVNVESIIQICFGSTTLRDWLRNLHTFVRTRFPALRVRYM